MAKIFKAALLMAAALTSVSASARVWRVNPNPNSGAEYQTVAQLQDNYDFVAGDTILLDPGNHGSITLNRENITIMGLGYFLGQNEEFAMNNSAVLGDLAMSANSKAIGLYVRYNLGLNNNCTVSRCLIGTLYGNSVTKNFCVIEQCYIKRFYGIYLKNSIIRNNILVAIPSEFYSSDFIYNTIVCPSTSNSLLSSATSDNNIQNNIFINNKDGVDSQGKPYSAFTLDFETLRNNNNNVSYNVFSTPEKFAETIFTVGNKYCGATVENTFVWEGSEDGKYRLKEGSPAKGASSNGGDCGAFGGALPYVLSGIPAFMPRITNANVPDSPTDGKIAVTLTIQTQNE